MIGVLIVEDDLPAAEALAEYIDRLSSFTVAGHARTGVEALRRAAADHVHLVLLDIYLPDISGLEVLRRLRGSGNTVDVVVVTRARDLSVIEAAVSYGVGLYLVSRSPTAACGNDSSDTRRTEQRRWTRAFFWVSRTSTSCWAGSGTPTSEVTSRRGSVASRSTQ